LGKKFLQYSREYGTPEEEWHPLKHDAKEGILKVRKTKMEPTLG